MKDMTRKIFSILIIVVTIIIVISCTKPNNGPDYSPPADHTINNGGYMHKPGFNQPLTNCITCHGSDLTGGSVGVSCYECHGKKW